MSRTFIENAKCVFAYGEKDFDYKKAKKNLPITYPAAKIEVWPGYEHCGKLSGDLENYAGMLKKICADEREDR